MISDTETRLVKKRFNFFPRYLYFVDLQKVCRIGFLDTYYEEKNYIYIESYGGMYAKVTNDIRHYKDNPDD